MPKRQPVQPVQGDLSAFVEDAFSDAEGLKDELQEWFDNLPENFQNGDKGDALQEAISNLESPSQPDVPECVAALTAEYTPTAKRRPSRRDRLGECIARLEAVKAEAESHVETLQGYEYDEETGEAVDDEGNKIEADDLGDKPANDEERDQQVSEIESFASEVQEAIDAWEGVEFPGMF